MNQDYINIYVTSNDLGQRIDVYLSEKINKISRNRIISLIKEKKVLFNNKVILSQSYILQKLANGLDIPITYRLSWQLVMDIYLL